MDKIVTRPQDIPNLTFTEAEVTKITPFMAEKTSDEGHMIETVEDILP